MTLHLLNYGQETDTDKIIALSRVLEILTDPSRLDVPNGIKLLATTSDKLQLLINGISITSAQT